MLLVLGSVRPERVLFFYASGPLFAFLVWVTLMRKKFEQPRRRSVLMILELLPEP